MNLKNGDKENEIFLSEKNLLLRGHGKGFLKFSFKKC
jgi:hypothetical protein